MRLRSAIQCARLRAARPTPRSPTAAVERRPALALREALRLQAIEQAAINRAHRIRRSQPRAVLGGPQRPRALVEDARALGVAGEQQAQLVRHGIQRERLLADAEALQVFAREIHAARRRVLAHVAQHVRELHGDAHRLGVVERARVVEAQHAHDQEADCRGDPVAVLVELVEGLDRRAAQVRLDAEQEVLEGLARQVEARDRVASASRRGARPCRRRAPRARRASARAGARGCRGSPGRRRCRRQPAERVDRVERAALRLREHQNAAAKLRWLRRVTPGSA
jgi:hypothetical protein